MTDRLVTTAEIARRARVTSIAVRRWTARHPAFPKPIYNTKGPLYNMQKVLDWLKATGRIK